jgi:hypothetical protein
MKSFYLVGSFSVSAMLNLQQILGMAHEKLTSIAIIALKIKCQVFYYWLENTKSCAIITSLQCYINKHIFIEIFLTKFSVNTAYHSLKAVQKQDCIWEKCYATALIQH